MHPETALRMRESQPSRILELDVVGACTVFAAHGVFTRAPSIRRSAPLTLPIRSEAVPTSTMPKPSPANDPGPVRTATALPAHREPGVDGRAAVGRRARIP